MKTNIFLLILGCIFLYGCGNKEYTYNETVASIYYETSNEFEDMYKKLKKNEYKTTFDRINEGANEFTAIHTNTRQDIKYLESIIKSGQERMNMLSPSNEAKEFHEMTTRYFTTIKDEFIPNLYLYTDINCDCPEKKDSITKVITKIYSNISDIEDKTLEIQKEYHKKIGM